MNPDFDPLTCNPKSPVQYNAEILSRDIDCTLIEIFYYLKKLQKLSLTAQSSLDIAITRYKFMRAMSQL